MAIKKKYAKGRLDKYYHMAKEQGYRARSAFKLIQINKKYNFLEKSKVCIDLCAAPGGWLQVAAKYMPRPSIIVGVDLAPIKPIPNVTTHVEDITSSKCRAILRSELKTWKADVVLHDGAPNVGVAWVQDAFAQSELTLSALKLATEFLIPGGTFVSKVFRSKDYNNLMWVFNQLFKSVEATKPASSRNVSAEIFVVCRDFIAPKKIDPKLLDPKHVFKDVEENFEELDDKKKKEMQGAVMNDLFHPEKKRRHREGYADGAAILHVVNSVSDFMRKVEFVTLLAKSNQLTFTTEEEKMIRNHHLTTDAIKEYCDDLRVLGKREFKELMKWRDGIREHLGLNPKKAVKEAEEEPEKTKTPEEEAEAMAEELSRQAAEMEAELKREKRKARGRKAKQLLRLRLGMETPTDIGLEVDGGMIVDDMDNQEEEEEDGRKKKIKATKLPAIVDDDDEEEDESETEDEEEVKVKHLEDEMNNLYELYEERIASRDPKAARKREKQGGKEFEEWYGVEWEQKQNAQIKRKRSDDASGSDSDSDSDSEGEEEMDEGKQLSNKAKMFFKSSLFEGLDSGEGLFSKDMGKGVLAASDSESDEDDYKPRKKVKMVKGEEDDDDDNAPPRAGYEIAPLLDADREIHDPNNNFIIDSAEKYTLAEKLIQKGSRRDLIDDAFNRYSFNDPDGMPEWFLQDEKRHSQRHLPVTKEAVQLMKARMRALDARPIKKVAEAKFRQKMKADNKLKKALKKATIVADDEDVPDRTKLRDASKIMKKALAKKTKRPEVVVARNMNRGLKGRPKGVKGRYKMVDGVTKKEKRNEKAREKKNKKRR